jgi:hypothetical protein
MKWILGAILILIGVAVACVFYYQYTTAPYRLEAAKTAKVVHQWEKPGEERTHNVKKEDVTETIPAVHQMPIAENRNIETTNVVKSSDSTRTVEMSEVTKKQQDDVVRMSPYGFGPYPKVPTGFPFEDPWTSPVSDLTEKEGRVFELIHRVHIKLWNEGKRPEGLSWENGVIYATYPNTIYVTWDYVENDDGTIERYPSEITSGTLSAEADVLLDEGIIPPDVIVYDHSEVGIDPYAYLELK